MAQMTAEQITTIIKRNLGDIKLIVRNGDDGTRIFIPRRAVDILEKGNIWATLGLDYEEKVLTDPNLRVFRV